MGSPSLPSPKNPTRMLNVCQFHKTHDTKTVDTVNGSLIIYDWAKYQGYDGYCTGQDDVSMTLDLYGYWEAEVVLPEFPPGVCLDFGAHIGWFTVQLAADHHVFAVDADPTNCVLLQMNLARRGLSATIRNSWVADIGGLNLPDVRFIKSDVEGHENEVVELCWDIINRDHPVLLLECSPEFDIYYPDMLQSLIDIGYASSVQPDELESQVNVWLR